VYKDGEIFNLSPVLFHFFPSFSEFPVVFESRRLRRRRRQFVVRQKDDRKNIHRPKKMQVRGDARALVLVPAPFSLSLSFFVGFLELEK
jgi:hypothetical protein